MNLTKKTRFYSARLFTLYIPLVIFLVAALFPLYWMIICSLKPDNEIASLVSPLWVKAPTLKNYSGLFSGTNFFAWYKNNIIVGVVTTLLALIISSLAAYSIARIKFGGRWVVSRSVLFSYLVPRTILFIPLFSILQLLKLTDTRTGLILSYLTFMVPFCTWLLIGYFIDIPKEIEECAQIDGCNRLQALIRVVLPITGPGLVTAALFSFTLSWNEFLYPLVFNTQSLKQVVPVGISDLQMGDVYVWGKIMAAGVAYSIPLVIVYSFIQRYLVEGMTAGAVKG